MARHREAIDQVVEGLNVPFVLDAGTGMYLNASILDVPIAPAVPEKLRARAEALSIEAGTSNSRRVSRETELELAGAEKRGSIWNGDLRFDVEVLYIRPDRAKLDAAIEARSHTIVHQGIKEARQLIETHPEGIPNPSVRDAIGVKELVEYIRGNTTLSEAEQNINTRTRQLSRKQLRWFDKLARTLDGRAGISILEDMNSPEDAVHRAVEVIQA